MEKTPIYDEYFGKYIENLSRWLPEGVIDVDLELLKRLGLLSFVHRPTCQVLERFTSIHDETKTTLINEDFIIWITIDRHKLPMASYVLIALNRPQGPKLECAFVAKGIYKTDEIIYPVLEKILYDIEDTERTLRGCE